MKTTIDIPEGILKEAMRFSGSGTKRGAVLTALEEYNRRCRMARLARRLGSFKRFMTRRELTGLREE